MSPLPWLLNWPPTRRSIAAFLLVSAFTGGTLLLFAPVTDQISPDEATIEVTDVSVGLNDELEFPDVGEDSIAKCTSYGTPADHLEVEAEIAVETPLNGGGYALDVGVTDTTTTESVDSGRDEVDVFWVFGDDETLSVGETTTVRFRLRDGESVVASVDRTVTVEERTLSYDCEE